MSRSFSATGTSRNTKYGFVSKPRRHRQENWSRREQRQHTRYRATNGPLFPILHHSVVWWRAAIADPTGVPGAQYIVSVRVIQDGNVVGMDAKTGKLTGTPVSGFIGLEVV